MPGCVLENPLRRLLGHHQRGRIGVAAGDDRHHTGIHHAQPRNQAARAAHAQPRIDHRHRIVIAPHLGGADRVKDGGGNVASQARQVGICLELDAGLELLRRIARQRRLRHDLARDPQRVGRHLAVGVGAQVVGRDQRRLVKARALDLHRAAAGRIQVADAGSEGVEAVQRLAKGVQAQRLHVVLDVGPGLGRVAAGEGAQLRGRHAHRAGALERVLQPDHRFAPERVGLHIEGLDAADLEHGADLQVVLQVGTHARCIVPHRNAVLLQQGARADARQLQQLRRANAAGAQDHLGARRGRDHLVATMHRDPAAAQPAVGQRLQHQRGHLGRGPHLEIGPGVAGGAQKGLGRVPAPA